MTEWCSGQRVGLITQRSEVRILVQSFLKAKAYSNGIQSKGRPVEKRMSFINYYVEYFEDDAEMFWFPKFKRLVR